MEHQERHISYDLIVVAKSSSQRLIDITQNCINSARADCDLNIIVVETGKGIVNYDAKIVHYTGPFNYNRALNLGLKHVTGDVHILANNDIIFHPGWSIMGEQMLLNGFDSACALSSDPRHDVFERGDFVYEGYIIGVHLPGWCIFVTRKCIEAIGELDESFEFWYSDNIYADQLQAAGIRHGIFCNVQVDHLTSCTLSTLSSSDQRRYSYAAIGKYKSIKKRYAV
ncbi:MAG: hypothetical protein PH343_01045 [Nitrospira sp.]|nr:hypothetical protein [Nitrospira sp.]